MTEYLELTEAVIIVSELKPWVAETVIGSNSVFTGPVSTRMPLTLINICKKAMVQSFQLEKHSLVNTFF